MSEEAAAAAAEVAQGQEDPASEDTASRGEGTEAVETATRSTRQRTLDTLFFNAVLQRPPDYTAARQALQQGANVNAEFEREGIFPIDIASVHYNLRLMSFLIAHGANTNQLAFDGSAPLHRAVTLRQLPMVQLLLETGRTNPNFTTARQGQEPVTPLQLAVTPNNHDNDNNNDDVCVDMARALVKHGGNVHVQRANGRSLLHLVSSSAMLDFLLQQPGMNVNHRMNNGSTPLHQACLVGNLPVVQGLIAAGADPNALNYRSGYPLHFACHAGHLATVQWLVQRGGANVHARGQMDRVALHVACSAKQGTVAEWLMDKCHMLPSLTDQKGYDALHFACQPRSPHHAHRDVGVAKELVRALLRRDPDLGKGDAYSVPTALHFAAEWSPELCRLLVKEYGFDLMAKSVLGSIPLGHATTAGTVETMHSLIDLMNEDDQDLNVGDARGLTALHEAILGGSLEKVRALLDRGLDVNAVSHCGETPLHAAGLTMGNASSRPSSRKNRKEKSDSYKDEDAQDVLCQTKILEAVIDRGAYALCLDQDNMYPFMYSAKKGNLDKTFLILRAAASQGFFGNPAVDTLAQKTSLKRKKKETEHGVHLKRARLHTS